MRLISGAYLFPVRLAVSLAGLIWCWKNLETGLVLPGAGVVLGDPCFWGIAITSILLVGALKALRFRFSLRNDPLRPAELECVSLGTFFLEGILLGPAESGTALAALLARTGAGCDGARRAVASGRRAGAASLGILFMAGALAGGLGSPAWAAGAVLFPLGAVATGGKPSKGTPLLAFLLSFLTQAFLLLPWPLALVSLGAHPGWLATALAVGPLLVAVRYLPSLGGLGLREALALFLLQPLLGPLAGLIALLVFAIWAVSCIIGAAAYLLGGHLAKQRG